MMDARFSIDDRDDDQEYERRTSVAAVPPDVPPKSPTPRPTDNQPTANVGLGAQGTGAREAVPKPGDSAPGAPPAS